MPFQVYDYRTTNKNVLVTPEIRARLYHMAPGQVDGRHSHDLGHEVFLILAGKAEFNIAGHIEVLEPGQMCVARADEVHQVRNLLADAPTIMYLSVTPHIQPTHTSRSEDDERLPPQFRPNAGYDDPDSGRSTETLLDAYIDSLSALAEETEKAVTEHAALADDWRQALAAGDGEAAAAARTAMFGAVYRLHKRLYALSACWNELAPRGDETS